MPLVTGTPASALSTPTTTPVSAAHRSKSLTQADDSDSDDLSLTGKDDGAIDDDDDEEFNTENAEKPSRRRGKKRSRSSASAVDLYLLPKSAPSQNPDRAVSIAEGIEISVGKLLTMTTAEIKGAQVGHPSCCY